ncbi:hypothetical protein P3547_19765 [Vibrio parahaemolyticus]|nr:hypothetical protein [Vibrio parahaemolyticus]
MTIIAQLEQKTELTADELKALLLELGYINHLKNPCSKTLSKMLNVSMRNAQRMLLKVGLSAVYYDHMLFQLGIKKPEFPIN